MIATQKTNIERYTIKDRQPISTKTESQYQPTNTHNSNAESQYRPTNTHDCNRKWISKDTVLDHMHTSLQRVTHMSTQRQTDMIHRHTTKSTWIEILKHSNYYKTQYQPTHTHYCNTRHTSKHKDRLIWFTDTLPKTHHLEILEHSNDYKTQYQPTHTHYCNARHTSKHKDTLAEFTDALPEAHCIKILEHTKYYKTQYQPANTHYCNTWRTNKHKDTLSLFTNTLSKHTTTHTLTAQQ